MPFDFEALVGHLYIVGGRSISAPPPGMLVEVAPKKAARGREMDTIFVLVLPAGESTASAAFYEQMAQTAAERYFSSAGSVTSGVRTVYSTLNQNLVDHNESGRRQYEANMLCAVLHGDDLFISRVGSGVALLHAQTETQPFPTSFENDDALFGPPLGVQPVPDIKMSRYRVTAGTRLVMADVTLAELSMEKMVEALGTTDIGEVLLGFKDLVTTHIALLALELVAPDTPSLLPVREGQSTATLISGGGAAVVSQAESPTPAAEDQAITSRLSEATGEARFRAKRGSSKAAMAMAGSLEVINKKIDRPKPAEGERRGLFANPTTSGMILFIPVAIVVLVVLMWLGGTGESEFELCVNEANRTAEMARSIASSDVNGTLAAWNAVILSVQRCNGLRAGDTQLASVTREGQDIIDHLSLIARREMIPIEAFPNATLTRIVLKGEDLYVLDDNNDLVYRVALRSDGLSANSKQAIASMRRGANVAQFTVGDLLDITWADDGSGLSQGNVLLALDREGVLIEYSPTFLARGVQKLLGTELWVNPIKMLMWQGRLYILDPGANQIWRYDPSGAAYPSSPLEYFTGQGRPNIANSVGFGIDSNGRIYILYADGVLSVYRTGELQPFGFSDFPENQAITTLDSMHLNIDPVKASIYLVSRINKTIYETSLAGTRFNIYRAYDEEMFGGLTNVVADESKGIVYALSGNTILAFQK